MKWFDSIRKFWKRRKFYKLNGGSTPTDFAIIRHILCHTLDRYYADAILFPNHGICFNAGMMLCDSRGTKIHRGQCTLFLTLCHLFNETRGIPYDGPYKAPFAFPFARDDASVSDGGFEKWVGTPGEVRASAMIWIVEQINLYDLAGDIHYNYYDDEDVFAPQGDIVYGDEYD